MMVNRCLFLTDESPLLVGGRQSVGLNRNANNIEIRHNRVTQFEHFAVHAGSFCRIGSNHIFHGDRANPGLRSASLLLTPMNNRAMINDNFIDSPRIQWGNEHDSAPYFQGKIQLADYRLRATVFG